MVLFFALLIAYPWVVLTIGTVLYLACLPFGWLSYRNYQRKDAEAAKPADAPAPAPPRAQDVAPPPAHPPAAAAEPAADPDRPARLN